MKMEDFNIISNVKIVEELKAELLCIIGDFYKLLVKGSNASEKAILECISGAITILYILADRLGYSNRTVDEEIKKKLKLGIIEKDNIEVEGKDLSKLYNYLKQRN